MAVISVEVPDKLAEKFVPYKVISSYELYEELQNKDILIEFGDKGVGKEEFNDYLEYKKAL